MKKLMIILLIGMLSLGLSGIAFAETQNISAQIAGSLTFSVPTVLSNWVLAYDTSTLPATDDNTTNDASAPGSADSHTAKIVSNCPYTLVVKVSEYPTGETVDNKMTTTVTTSNDTDLDQALQLMYYTGASDVTSGSSPVFTSLADVTTGDQGFLTTTLAPDDGTDIIGIQFNQNTTANDPAYHGGSQLTYQIQLTWTASATI